jgi:hypothetical protein
MDVGRKSAVDPGKWQIYENYVENLDEDWEKP